MPRGKLPPTVPTACTCCLGGLPLLRREPLPLLATATHTALPCWHHKGWAPCLSTLLNPKPWTPKPTATSKVASPCEWLAAVSLAQRDGYIVMAPCLSITECTQLQQVAHMRVAPCPSCCPAWQMVGSSIPALLSACACHNPDVSWRFGENHPASRELLSCV